MIDVTGVTTRFSADRIRRFARVIRQREEESQVGPIGVVAGSLDAHRQAILFAKQAQRHRPIKVFHEQHDARKWLDALVGEDQSRPIGGPSHREIERNGDALGTAAIGSYLV
jgi:hypothetical protein